MVSPEQSSALELRSPKEKLRASIDLQIELMKRAGFLRDDMNSEEKDNAPVQWAQTGYAGQFRDYVDHHPDILALFTHDPDAAIKIMQESLGIVLQ